MNNDELIKYFLFEDGTVAGERYKSREKFWREKGLWQSGYYPELEQVALKVMLYNNSKDSLFNTIKTLNEIIPHLKADKSGCIRIGVFEHTLSENGVYEIKISDNKYVLELWRFHRIADQKQFDKIESLLEYVQMYHYYE